MCFVAWVTQVFVASAQAIEWWGATNDWIEMAPGLLQSNLSEPGTSWICTCPAAEGGDIEWRWAADFAGSSANFTRTLFFSLPTGTSPADLAFDDPLLALRIGEAGSEDGLICSLPNGSTIHALSGQLASGFDAAWRFTGDELTSNAPDLPVLLPVTSLPIPTPDCIGFEVTLTNSNLDGVTVGLNHWHAWAPDTLPPQVTAVELLAPDTALWSFNEAISQGDPVAWQKKQALSTALVPGIASAIAAPVVEDFSGNSGGGSIHSVAWTNADLLAPGSLRFTEILCDPTPSDWLPAAEWVEIANTSPFVLQLEYLTWWDAGSGPSMVQPLAPWNGQLHPGERAILSTADTLLFQGVHQAHLPDGGSLADYGDAIALLPPSGQAIDSVSFGYSNTWDSEGRNGRSWSRTHLDGCSGPANWRASVSPAGASPGSQDWGESSGPSPWADSTIPPPHIIPMGPGQWEIAFNQPVDPQFPAIEDVDLMLIADTIMHAEARQFSAHRPLHLAPIVPCFQPDSAWQVTLKTEGRFPRAGDLAISEIQAQSTSSSPEWIEITHIGADSLHVAALTVNGVRSTTDLLAPGERMIVSFPGPHDLPNSSGDITLLDGLGHPLESIRYTECFFDRQSDEDSGRSLVRKCLGRSGNDPGNWSASRDPTGASPGKPDPAEGCPPIAAPRWMLCGNKGAQAVLRLSQPAAEVDGASALDHGLTWQFATDQHPESVILRSTEGEWIAERPAHCLRAEYPPTVRWTEMLGDTPIEPFVAIQGDGPFETADLQWTDGEWVDRSGFGDDGVNWWVPGGGEWAFAACPDRLAADQVLKMMQMPGFWHRPEIELLDVSGEVPEMLDSMRWHPDRHAPWVESTEGVSLERCGEGWVWLSCRTPEGHSAGQANSASSFCTSAAATGSVQPAIWIPGERPLRVQYCGEVSSDCVPVIREAWSEARIAELSGATGTGECLSWTWEGDNERGPGVPPVGDYFVEIPGCISRRQSLPFAVRSP
jgi:hypothetical protein